MNVATLANPLSDLQREQRFFFRMACVMAAVIVAGFSFSLAMGRSNFGLPLIYHIHAFVFFGWLCLYVLQNGLVAAGNVALHRRLGLLGVGWVPLMVALGLAMTVASARRGGPFFFDVNEFIFGNAMQVLAFGLLAGSAMILRQRIDWHRRLMFCGTAILTGPGFGRLLPAPLFIPWAWWVSVLITLVFPLIGVAADLKRTGRAHPAWFWGMGAIVAGLLLGDLIAYSQAGLDATQAIVAGTPGADRPLHAFLP